MIYAIEIKEEAEREIAVAFTWYEDQLPGLGFRFIEALEDRLLDISKHPTHYSYINEDNRKVYRDVRLKGASNKPSGKACPFHNTGVYLL